MKRMTLRRQVRRLPISLMVEQLLAALERQMQPATVLDARELVTEARRLFGDRLFVVGELVAAGVVEPKEAHKVGYLLAALAREAEPVAGLLVERVGPTRAGVGWCVRRVR